MSGLNPDNPLGRHSGEGRNPVIKNAPRSGQNHDVVPLPWEIVDQLDSGLRRNDTILANGQSGLNDHLDSNVLSVTTAAD